MTISWKFVALILAVVGIVSEARTFGGSVVTHADGAAPVTIRTRLFADANGDGFAGRGDHGVAGITVTVIGGSNRFPEIAQEARSTGRGAVEWVIPMDNVTNPQFASLRVCTNDTRWAFEGGAPWTAYPGGPSFRSCVDWGGLLAYEQHDLPMQRAAR